MTTTGTTQSTSNSNWTKLSTLSGAAFIVVFLAGNLMIGAFEYLRPPEELQSFLQDGSDRIYAGAYISTLSAFFLLWFAGSAYIRMRDVESESEHFSAVAFAGATVSGAIVLVSSAAIMVAASRAGSDGSIGPAAAVAFHDLYASVIGSGFAISMAVFIGATAAVAFRTRAFSRWFAWFSAVSALALLTPFNWAALALVTPWVFVLSLLMYSQARTGNSPVAAQNGSSLPEAGLAD